MIPPGHGPFLSLDSSLRNEDLMVGQNHVSRNTMMTIGTTIEIPTAIRMRAETSIWVSMRSIRPTNSMVQQTFDQLTTGPEDAQSPIGPRARVVRPPPSAIDDPMGESMSMTEAAKVSSAFPMPTLNSFEP